MKTKNMLIIGTVLAALAGVYGCSSNNEKPKETPVEEIVNIPITEHRNISSSDGRVWRTIEYNGVGCDNKFSLSLAFDRSAVNTFYPDTAKNIKFYGTQMKVISVTPENLTVSYTR